MKSFYVWLLLAIGHLAAMPYELSICAIFKDEAPYLREWIEFHKMQGVTHFFLYNNNSQDDYFEILAPYIRAHEVTLIPWPYAYKQTNDLQAIINPWTEIQRNSYTHCLQHYGKLTSWLAAIDIDEFLFCPSGEPLPSFLRNFINYGGLCVNWLLFGTSGYEDLPEGTLLIEALTKCASPTNYRNKLVKSIVQPRFVVSGQDPHIFTYKKPYYAVTADGTPLLNGKRSSEHLLIHKIRINHYWTRTERYFREKKIPSRLARRTQQVQGLINSKNSYNTCEDSAILQFVSRLKEILAKKENEE